MSSHKLPEPSPDTPQGNEDSLGAYTLELLPFNKSWAHGMEVLHPSYSVAITTTEYNTDDPTGRTLSRAAEATELGHEAIPHIAARCVGSMANVKKIVHKLEESGVSRLFIVGGDSEYDPDAEISDGFGLLRAILDFENTRPERVIKSVGFPSYPQGHHNDKDLPPEVTWVDLRRKQDLALAAGAEDVYTETQFDANAPNFIGWMAQHKEHGLTIPVQVGILGAVTVKAGWRAMTMNGGPMKALEFARTSGLSKRSLITGSHVNKSIHMGRAVVEASTADSSLPQIRGFTISTIGAVEESVDRFSELEQLSESLKTEETEDK